MPAKKAVKDKEPPADLPKKPPSAFSRFCTDHRERFKDKYGELGMVERKEKMSEVWTTMQGNEERKKYEKAFENDMEEWKRACEEVGSKGKKAAGAGKGEESSVVKDGGKADGADRGKADGKTSKHDMERKSLLQKLTALGQTLSVIALTCHIAPHRFPPHSTRAVLFCTFSNCVCQRDFPARWSSIFLIPQLGRPRLRTSPRSTGHSRASSATLPNGRCPKMLKKRPNFCSTSRPAR